MATQYQLKVYAFRENNWSRLGNLVSADPEHGHLGEHSDKSLAGHLFSRGTPYRLLYYSDSRDLQHWVDLVHKAGFMVEGKIPPPYIRIKPKPAKGKKQDAGRMKREIEHRGLLKSFDFGGYIFAHEDFDEKVIAIIQKCGFEPHEEKTYKQ